MDFKKSIKKNISSLLPKGIYKEKLKVFWYNVLASKKVKYKIVSKEGANFMYETKYEDLTFFTNEPLYAITPDFDNYQHFYKVKEGDVVIDGGANVGVLSLLFSKQVGQTGHVYCFEPDKYNIGKLNSNFSLNNHARNYSIHGELMWSCENIIDFQESGTVASSAIWFSDEHAVVKKRTITLDSWCVKNNIKHIDLIKMDIEGAELEAVEGCRDIIKQFKPNFAIASYHMVDGEPTYIKLEAFFKSIGYPVKTKKFSGYEVITFAGPCVKDE
ncbi:FkbM family methyltransferase [Bizionia argentinensis JUB59]|uniref:FkbM family methyltransferase n=1 Tax=Bizionia argentinensis JUB59 TaxID=1046627 RepID=G2EAT6_9FLAO|nr:FkbM family methyltransferase [Bizionia argentinensis]EGV44327.1 FkbM family methyltransferase [Bizionia argentinensis JUB59]